MGKIYYGNKMITADYVSAVIPCHCMPYLTLPNRANACPVTPAHNSPYPTSTTSPSIYRVHHMRVSLFVARHTQRFQVRRVICAHLRQFQYMMDVASEQLDSITAVLASALITLVHVLAQWTPKLYGHSRIPGKVQSVQSFDGECFVARDISSHTSPYRAGARHTVPRLACSCHTAPWSAATTRNKPCLIGPRRASSHRALPNQSLTGPEPTSPELTQPYPQSINLALPHIALPIRACGYLTATTRIEPCHTLPERAMPSHSEPSRDRPCPTRPNRSHKLTLHSECSNHKSAKSGPEITDTDRATCEDQAVVHNVRGQLIIDHGDLEIQCPPRLEARPDTHNACALHNDRAAIEIQRFVSIGVQFIGCVNAVQDFIRADEHCSFEKLLIGRAALAGDLEVRSRLDHCAFDMNGGLIDLTGLGRIQVFTPFLCVILAAGRLLAAFAQISKLWHRIAMLHKRRGSDDPTIDRVHKPSTKIAPNDCTCVLVERTQRAIRGWYESANSTHIHWAKTKRLCVTLCSLDSVYYSIGKRHWQPYSN